MVNKLSVNIIYVKKIREEKFRCSDLIEITPLSSCTIIDFFIYSIEHKISILQKNFGFNFIYNKR